MQPRENAYLRSQLHRFMRPDAARFLRPDAARFRRSGDAKASVYPAFAAKWDGQPRIPEGEEGGGRFTFGLESETIDPHPELPHVYITTHSGEGDGGPGNNGDASPFGNELDSFLLAGDLGSPSEQPPEIPQDRPGKSVQRNAVLRSIASFLGRNGGFVADMFIGLMNEIEWLETYQDLIQAARDPPKTLAELQSNVGKGRPGYDDHHIIEKTAAEKWGMSRSDINDRSNLVSIPRLKHYQITGWFMKKNDTFGGLSPREYLSDKGPEQRRRVGLEALELLKVLKR